MNSSSLESVMSSQSTGSGGVSKLIAAAEGTTVLPPGGLKLQMLDLGDSRMSETGAEKLAKLIEANTNIVTLNLTGNKTVGMAGWLAVADALKINKVIKTLSLDYNDLGDAGASLIAEALKENPCVESLDLEGNKIGDEGGKKLLEMVQENSVIGDITLLPGNNIDRRMMQNIKDTLLNRVVES